MWGEAPPHAHALATSSASLWTALKTHPEGIPDDMREQRRAPIGRYFERLVAFWLAKQPGVSNFHENLRVQGASETLGEIDMLFTYALHVYHWELAVKFYLGVGDLSSASSWHGPRARDRLDTKLDKLLGKQLQLPSHPEAAACLAALGMTSPESYAFVKGYLFHPIDCWQDRSVELPAGVNPDHKRGWWLPVQRCGELHSLPAAGWQILQKPDWLAPWRGEPEILPSELTTSLARCVGEYGPTMLAAVGDDGSELHRGFVVPETWTPIR